MSEQPVISLLGSTALLFEAPGALALADEQNLTQQSQIGRAHV